MRVLVRFFLSPEGAAVFLPASFFSVAGALPAGALPAVVCEKKCKSDKCDCLRLEIASKTYLGSGGLRGGHFDCGFGCSLKVLNDFEMSLRRWTVEIDGYSSSGLGKEERERVGGARCWRAYVVNLESGTVRYQSRAFPPMLFWQVTVGLAPFPFSA